MLVRVSFFLIIALPFINVFLIPNLAVEQVADLLEARAVEGRGESLPYLQAVFKGKCGVIFRSVTRVLVPTKTHYLFD